MKDRNKPPEQDWRALLRLGDPALDQDRPTAEELRRLRSKILGAARPKRSASRYYAPAWAIAGSCLLVLLFSWGVYYLDRSWPATSSQSPVSPRADRHTRPADLQGEGRHRQQKVQFSTPGGTRVIWILDSNFEV